MNQNGKKGELLKIGSIHQEPGTSRVLIEKQYRAGLKYLSLFSHAILLYGRQESSQNRMLFQKMTVQLLAVEENRGTVLFETDQELETDSVVFDIKPYFPCEDRVKQYKAPQIVQEKYRNINNVKESSIEIKGSIRKEEGEFYIETEEPGIFEWIGTCSHAIVFWWFHRYEDKKYRKIVECRPPYENAPVTGVFATRSPVRPNPVAMTTVRILKAEGSRIYVSQMDCFDHTPCIGMIPYTEADDIETCCVPEWLSHWPQWLDDRSLQQPEPGSQWRLSPLEQFLKEGKKSPYTVEEKFWEEIKETREYSGISVKGGRENNLKNISVDIPYHQITVITGVSGSGKSSLAFDTLHAECRRRFLDMSGGAEKYLKKPDMDSLSGAIPSIAISQKGIGNNVRSTVGTYTDLYDGIRTVFATVGVRHCPQCKEAVKPMTEEEITGLLSGYEEIEIVTPDQQRVTEGTITERIHKALVMGKGAFWADIKGKEPFLMQTTQMCYHCSRIMYDLTPSAFNYSDPESMCPVCNGYGTKAQVDPEAIISHPECSILDGASELWGNLRSFRDSPNANWVKGEVLALANDRKVNLELPWKELPEEFRQQVLYGSGERSVLFEYKNSRNGRSGSILRPAEGIYHVIKRLYRERSGDERWKKLVRQVTCQCCNGERLSAEGRMVTVGKYRYPEIASLPVSKLREWCRELPQILDEPEFRMIQTVVGKLYRMAGQAMELGIGYLQMDRPTTGLSGGERQRLKLLTQLNSNISGILYVLDEPTAGLHPRDYEKLIQFIYHLRDNKNTIVLVEHNQDIIRIADHLIEVGPGAGEAGGHITAQGTWEQIRKKKQGRIFSILQGEEEAVTERADMEQSTWISISNAKEHNLKNINVTFPTGAITCITGISGSGKSSLLKGVIFPEISGANGGPEFSTVVLADQLPIGKTPRSVPATFLGIMDEIRLLFAGTREAKRDKLKINAFSFNSKEGQCESCNGAGQIIPEFTGDMWITCPVCKGKRYKKQILEIRYRKYSIADILELSIQEARSVFADQAKIADVLDILIEVGLGYLKLGQSTTVLSGGEAQRLKLAKELSGKGTGKTLYLFDEPAAGLHFDDIKNLMILFRKLVRNGNTIVMIEHRRDVIQNADWIIELGPGAGDEGGYLLSQGRNK